MTTPQKADPAPATPETALQALLAIVRRNLSLARRRIELIAPAAAVPTLLIIMLAIMFGSADAFPVALTDADHSPASAQFIHAMEQTQGVKGPLYHVIETDPDVAQAMVKAGRLAVAITLPNGFAADRTVEITTYNINTDAMKNVRLRINSTANIMDRLNGDAVVLAQLIKQRPWDPSRNSFMGGSAILLALVLGAALSAGNLLALEHGDRTIREFVLTPVGPGIGAVGAVVAGVIIGFISAIPTTLVALAFGFDPSPLHALASLAIAVPAMVAAAGLSVAIAHGLRSHSTLQPLIILIALGSYFASGGFVSVAAMPPVARTFAVWWPPSYLWEWANPVLHGFAELRAERVLAWLVAATLATALAYLSGQHETTNAARTGQ